jgi:hypothetical protein
LGKFNVLCIEDIVHELSSSGKYFNEVMKDPYGQKLKIEITRDYKKII